MARFVRLAPCPKCGSRDNLATYDDGSAWCFGCKHYEPRSADRFIPTHRVEEGEDEESLSGLRLFRDALSDISPSIGLFDTLKKSNITIPELLRAGAMGRGEDSLAFPYYTATGELACVQVRQYGSKREGIPKYLNRGSTERAFPLYHYHPADHRVVITEDTLSALKVARVTNSFSALGTNVQTHKLTELLKRGFQRVFVWLDKDKWREGREICDKAKWIGLSATALLTDLDPKYYTEDEITAYLK